jgi:hypothetical protein
LPIGLPGHKDPNVEALFNCNILTIYEHRAIITKMKTW